MLLSRQQQAGRGAASSRQTDAPSLRAHRPPRHAGVRCFAKASISEADTATEAGSENLSDAASRCPVLKNLRPLQPPILSRWESLALSSLSAVDTTNRALSKDKIAGTWFLGTPSVIIGDPTALKEIGELEQQNIITAGYPTSTVMLLGKHSIAMVQDPKKHKFLRRMLMPVSSQDAIDSYLPDIKQLAEETLASWVERCKSTNEVVIAAPDLKSFTFAVITKVVLGMELSAKDRKDFENDFQIWLKELFSALPINQWPFPFRESMKARERMLQRINLAIQKERAAIAADEAKGVAYAPGNRKILRRLLAEKDENGRGLSDEEAADNLLNFLFAGHDTTFAHLTRLMYDLEANPEVLEKLRQEQKEVIARFGPDMTPKAVRAMNYASAVSQESLRLTPPVAGVLRNGREDFALKGIAIPGKQVINISTSYMARNDSRWPQGTDSPLDLTKFNPDRFLTPEGQDQGAQHQFGFGSHMCLGINLVWAETRVFLAALARGYNFKADLNTQWSNFPLLHPTNGLPLWVERL